MQDGNFRDGFGYAVKFARRSKGMTQVQLAEKLCITTRYLKGIENSGRTPSYDLFVRIIEELSIRADFIIYPENKTEPSKVYTLQKIAE